MCGIVGALNLVERPPVSAQIMRGMLETIRHRGPDGFGIYLGDQVALGNARLSIIDLTGGDQPIGNEDGTLWIVFNGEIFNYIELRQELEKCGHRFTTACDTEVIVHLYEQYGPACLEHLNGQFAIAIWDERQRSLFLGRDRVGIRPLFYTVFNGRLFFCSEMKSLLAFPGFRLEIDPAALMQVFTFWSVQTPFTIFKDVFEIPPGHYLLAQNGGFAVHHYWSPDFTAPERRADDILDEFESLFIDATRIRLRADVPVGAYLSGGLDSSLTAAVIRYYTNTPLDTFSIAFSDPEFDESLYQRQMAQYLGTNHQVVFCTVEDIGQVFPDIIWHTETPVLRTAPAPMFLLSRLVHQNQYKVVLTGEGADELLAGYDIFKEMAIRRFWARVPQSEIRPLLLNRLYPEISTLSSTNRAFLTAFFSKELTCTESAFYSHRIRWSNTARIQRFLSGPLEQAAHLEDEIVPLPKDFTGWSGLSQAQYLEIVTFLSSYLLSSQGDRVAMAHSVEGRYPFLDFRVINFCNRLPDGVKLRGLQEKWLLRQMGKKLLPAEIWRRRKRPYRAPIQRSFLSSKSPDYVGQLLSDESIKASGYFNPAAVAGLSRKASGSARLSEVDEMALVGILSTQLVHHQFVQRSSGPEELFSPVRMKIVDHLFA
jgi:asparagine synthase (glutamine-hydrolysing)